jgi:hypothetical protein
MISIYIQIAQMEENLLTVKKNCSRKSNLLQARICSKNLLTDFARSIEKLLTMWARMDQHDG